MRALPLDPGKAVPTPDRRIASLAERQHSLFTRAQALGYGFSPDAIDGRLRRGLWQRVHGGVYRVRGRHRRPSGT